MWLMIVLKVTKNQGFTLSLEDTFFEKPIRMGGDGGGMGGQFDHPHRSRFRVKLTNLNFGPKRVFPMENGKNEYHH